MIIANPIYDTSFKKVMENNNAAKTLIGTILGCEILSLEESPTERTKEIITQPTYPTLYRLDYAAVIKTKDDKKRKVLIEVQKSFDKSDIYRFRDYLGNEYIKSKLDIITIYFLGFKLKVASPAFVTGLDCHDIRTLKPVEKKDDIVRKLSHTAYFIQTKRIDPCEDTLLDQLLTIFQQKTFINGGETLKPLLVSNIDPQLKEIVNILEYVAKNKKLKGQIDEEYEQLRRYERYYGDRIQKEYEREKVLEETLKALEEKYKALEEKDKTIKSTVLNLHKSGMSIEKISEVTGLCTAEVKKIVGKR